MCDAPAIGVRSRGREGLACRSGLPSPGTPSRAHVSRVRRIIPAIRYNRCAMWRDDRRLAVSSPAMLRRRLVRGARREIVDRHEADIQLRSVAVNRNFADLARILERLRTKCPNYCHLVPKNAHHMRKTTMSLLCRPRLIFASPAAGPNCFVVQLPHGVLGSSSHALGPGSRTVGSRGSRVTCTLPSPAIR